MDGLAIGSLGSQTCHASLGEPHCMFGHCEKVEIFVVFEKGNGRHVDAGSHSSAHMDVIDG